MNSFILVASTMCSVCKGVDKSTYNILIYVWSFLNLALRHGPNASAKARMLAVVAEFSLAAELSAFSMYGNAELTRRHAHVCHHGEISHLPLPSHWRSGVSDLSRQEY